MTQAVNEVLKDDKTEQRGIVPIPQVPPQTESDHMTDSNNPTPSSADNSLEGPDVEVPTDDEDGTTKPDGLGKDGTIPDNPNGVAVGYTGEASTFEPEEDET